MRSTRDLGVGILDRRGAEFVPVNSILGTQLWRERDAGGHQPDYQNGSEEESEVRPT